MEQLVGQLRQTLGNPPREEIPIGAVYPDSLDPHAFWARFIAGLESGRDIILQDPSWPADWRSRLALQLAGLPPTPTGRVLIPTGGTSGLPKFCLHDTGTITAAAGGYATRCGDRGILHAVNVLPQHHVGGLMPVFRSAACGGRTHFADYRNPAAIRSAPFPLSRASLSLVPTQLRRMLDSAELTSVLRSFAQVLVGGAGCPPDLLASARQLEVRLAPCYGSTETAAMVTMLDPEEFLGGTAGVGRPLPHVRIEIDGSQRICIHAQSNLRGYWPEQGDFQRDPLRTGDNGHLDANGFLFIHGRADRVLITGGEKVHPEQVEAAALTGGLVSDAWCHGEADPDWGTRIILEAVPALPGLKPEDLLGDLRRRLPPYAVPKSVLFPDRLHRSELGKLRNPDPPR